MKIIKFEFEKVLKNKIVIGSLVISFIVLLGIFFVGYNYSQFKMSERNNVNKGFPKNIDTIISQKYAGDFTDKKVQMILSDSMNQFQENEEKGVTDKPFYLFYWQMGDNFFDDDSENIYTEMIQKVKSGERLLLDDVSVHSIRDLGFTEFEKPLQIGNYVPWTDFFSVIGNINLLICVLTILICSTIFSNDTSKNVNQILLITKLGRNKMIFAKIIVGTVIPLCTLILFHLLNAGIFSLMYDTMETLGDQFIEEMRVLSESGGGKKIKQFKQELELAEKRIAEIDSIIMKLFEQNVAGKISDGRFEKMSVTYENEQRELEERRKALKEKIEAEDYKTKNTNQFLETIRKYENVTEFPSLE